MKPFASILAAATLSVVCQQAAFASPEAAYPTKPVKVVVGYAPGGSSDAVARLIAGRLSDKLGQTFVVENRPGAASNIAAATVARSPNDGYTILLGSNASTINVSLYKELSFDFQKDFAPVALLTRFPNIMVVNNTVPAKTVQEFITYAKANPKNIFFASSGAGSSTRLSAELFKMMTGVEMEHVQYKGSAPALTDLMAGRIQVMFDTAPSVMPLIKGDKLRALGVTSATTQPFAPEIPTIDASVKGYEMTSWYALFAPAGTPAGIVEKLNKEVNAILEEKDIQEKLAGMVATPGGGTPEELRKHVASEIAKYADVVKASGATAD
ncbi:tripartite tricarboxylate transporter substrate binding protein [Achromobacter insolitus]|jgi:tripartite-type tricarboxylate transporter receptor subunit TctC|uniref:Bug family tripartite tricarboxylate transporter substrate binding protein n=1 Tax=Achromobacter TaxID=222 RepID=UPI00097266B1|nr:MULTISPECIES: tripartite tricarboxylate transporter substrate binding protein [Achromobacter]GLK95742.1 MFS transporter [Achromobacter xylosoxidans]APX78421.1 MFS transporter [Achromobacter insolitus]AXA74339.1 MFS transporter [Achromobacter insolitus]MCP1400967.1 tripartite-type tricarboxylate transporter receptor subunit TctC [Achromobacter insolitus]MDQ6216874.1 tripartite tricarboxylate transporter substrate binding protein [Achromobacter insolitus]